MRIIFSTGNPGKKYLLTRHNTGFLFLDYFASKYNLKFTAGKGEYYKCEGTADENDFILVKPVTYVNLSGIAASQILELYKEKVSNFLLVYDDINLPFGEIRVRASGGSGGHNGISSIIEKLSSDKFPRIRIGVGSEFDKGDMADYVLSEFDKLELQVLEDKFKIVEELVISFCTGGIKSMLNTNSKINTNT